MASFDLNYLYKDPVSKYVGSHGFNTWAGERGTIQLKIISKSHLTMSFVCVFCRI